MNYIAEIKAFYDRLELNPQPNTAIALWHALMSIANKAGWPDTFTVAQSVLGLRSGLNASALKRARNKLATDGFIEWKSRGGNQSAQYRIISLVVQNYSQNEPQFEPQSEPQNEPQFEPQSEPINKHKLKQEKEVPKGTKKKFSPPTVLEVAAYCVERNNGINAEAFVDYYAANGWVQGKSRKPITDWKACIRTWERNKEHESESNQKKVNSVGEKKNKFNNFNQRNYDYDNLEKMLLTTSADGNQRGEIYNES